MSRWRDARLYAHIAARLTLLSIPVDDCSAISVESACRAYAATPIAVAYGQNYQPAWAQPSSMEEPSVSWSRYFSALKRYKWLILLVVLAGTGIGFGVTQFMAPAYQTTGHDVDLAATSYATGGGSAQGPIEGQPLVTPGAWADLIKSSAIMDNVVRKLSLYLWPQFAKDSAVFAGFQPRPGLHSGTYALSHRRIEHALHAGDEGRQGRRARTRGRFRGAHARLRHGSPRRMCSDRRASCPSPS